MVESDKIGDLFSKGYLQETEKAKRQLTELEGELDFCILRSTKHQDSTTKAGVDWGVLCVEAQIFHMSPINEFPFLHPMSFHLNFRPVGRIQKT